MMQSPKHLPSFGLLTWPIMPRMEVATPKQLSNLGPARAEVKPLDGQRVMQNGKIAKSWEPPCRPRRLFGIPNADGEWHGATLPMLDLGLCNVFDFNIGIVFKPYVYGRLQFVGRAFVEDFNLHWHCINSLLNNYITE